MKYRSCKRLFILVVSICLTGIGKSQTPETPPGPYTGISINYVRTWDALAPEINENNLIARPLQDVSQATQYIDGIGRPLQAVIKQASLETNGAATDMVSPIVYDIYGREALKYLPFASTGNDGSFKTNPFQQQVSFYNTQLSGQAGETNVGAGLLNWAYRKTNFEQSPLSRPEKMLPEGVSWAGGPNGGRGVENKYFLNTTVDAVRKWKVTNNGITNFGSYASPGLYNPQELYKTIAIDEHGKQVIEFKDKEGKVVLKKVQLTGPPDDGTGIPPSGSAGVWLCTYYIYDDLNNLRCVIQPKGVETVSPTGILTDPTVLAEQCFRYEYDERNRMIIKKIPGAEAVYMVYDRWDRLILMQDGNQRLTNGWIFTKYDEQNRPVLTGLHGDPTNTTLTAMIAHVKANESWQIRYESVNTSLPYGYTTTQTYPYGSSPTILTATHYDDYNGLPAGFTGSYMNTWNSYFSATGNTWPYPQLPQQSMATRGMATWSQVNVLGTGTMLTTVMIYDDKGRVIQVQNTNITGGLDVITTQYTWSGQPLVIVQKQEKQGANAQITVAVTQLTYDNLGRLVKTEKKVSNTLVPVNGVLGAMPQTFKTIAQNEYDKLGQLKNKKLAPAYNNNAGLEALNYDYNIRGWLLGMNRDYARDVIPPSGGGGAYFGFDLGYDKANNNIIGGQTYTNPQYNGNIEGMVWKSKGAGEKRKYDFAYDAANRLLKADFTQYTGSTFNQNAGVNFNIKMGDGINANTAYDANGNIQQMQQWGLKITGSVQIDNLAYTYQNNSNKLAKVTDSYSDPTTKLGDFKDGTNGASDDYGYDVNGNLNLDNNKAISSITYNHLNLPSVITVAGKGTISYTYDAGGNKIKKQTSDISTPFSVVCFD